MHIHYNVCVNDFYFRNFYHLSFNYVHFFDSHYHSRNFNFVNRKKCVYVTFDTFFIFYIFSSEFAFHLLNHLSNGYYLAHFFASHQNKTNWNMCITNWFHLWKKVILTLWKTFEYQGLFERYRLFWRLYIPQHMVFNANVISRTRLYIVVYFILYVNKLINSIYGFLLF